MIDPTTSKEIALYFIGKCKLPFNGQNIKINVSIAKQLLKTYSKEEIIKVIDYLIDVNKTSPKSLALVRFTISDKLIEIKEKEEKDKLIEEYKKKEENKVYGGVEKNEHNRNENKNIGNNQKSWFRKSDYQHLFKE